jgi:hypothetical protein
MWRKVLSLVELVAFLVVSATIAVGTWVNFALPRFHGVPAPDSGCYLTDDGLVVFAQCDNQLLAEALNWAWWLTWALPWMIGYLVYGLPILVLEFALIVLAISFVARLISARNRRSK